MRKVALHFLGSLLTATVIFVCCAIFGNTIGYSNTFSAITFWGILVPIVAYLSSGILRKNSQLITALTGTVFFYALVFFTTYDHFDTDLFTIMKYSMASSLLLLTIYHYYSKSYDKMFSDKLKT
jgi:hypothetical protein